MHLTDTSLSSADWKSKVLVTIVVPSPCSKADEMGGPRVLLSTPTSHVISAGGRDWAVQFASVTPGEDVTWLTSGLGKTGERIGGYVQIIEHFCVSILLYAAFKSGETEADKQNT